MVKAPSRLQTPLPPVPQASETQAIVPVFIVGMPRSGATLPDQVRKNLNQGGIGGHAPYAEWLGELSDALERQT